MIIFIKRLIQTLDKSIISLERVAPSIIYVV